MSEINLKCKNCGANMQVDREAKMITCMHCGASHLFSEILDEHDLEFLNKLSANELGDKLLFNDALKQGETYLFKAEYSKAEECFKLAISYDEKSFKGYLGVVKAKTNNFNKLPTVADYEEYAKSALKLAEGDDHLFVKNELSKISFLKQEAAKLKKEQNLKKEKEKNIEASRRIKANFFSKLAYFITGLIAVVVLIGLVISTIIKNKERQDIPSTIEISSTEEFLNFAKNSKFYKSTIILKSDLDFNGKTIEPIGKDKYFSGAIRGNGHVIKNLNISKSEIDNNYYIGLFSKLDGAKISGIVFDNVNIVFEEKDNTSKNLNSFSVGLIAGYAKNTEFSNCEIFENCSIELNDSNSSIILGGLVGELDSSSIKLCYSNATININENLNDKPQHLIGGLVGYFNDSSLNASYCSSTIKSNINITANVNSSVYISGLVGTATFLNIDSKISHCFFSGSIDAGTSLPNKQNFIASISNFVENQNSNNKIYSNFVLFENENFVLNGNNISLSDIKDLSEKNYSVALTEPELIEKINEIFSSERWENLDSIKPNLKDLKNAPNENGAFLF